MSHIYPHYMHRSSSHQRSFPEQQKPTNRQRASHEIRFHQPFQRLQRRLQFNKAFIEHCIPEGDLLKNDNFALFDAVAKRGGYSQVHPNRWQQINLCLDYEKKQWNFSKYYTEVLLPHETKLCQLLGWYPKDEIYQQQVLEMHLLPSNNLTNSYYLLMQSEYVFAFQNFNSMDEYFNLKTIALLEPDISKIPVEYSDKYMMLRKKLLFSHQIKDVTPLQLKRLSILPNSDSKVIIVGLSLSTLMIADKLSEFGLTVTIIDKAKKEAKYREDNQIVENGIVMLEGGKQCGSYYWHLNSIGVGMQECPGYSVLLDEDGRPIPEQKLRIAEQHFLNLVNQMKQEIMNRKKFYEELMSRVMKKSKLLLITGMESMKGLIKWHHDRYMMMNRIKGENTTVGDLVAYQSRHFVKFISQPHLILVLRNQNKLYQRVKSRKNVNIVTESIESTQYINGSWNVKLKNEAVLGKYMIYADQTSLYRSYITSNPSISDIGSDVMGDSISILQQLTGVKYINCLYTFKEKVAFKETMNGINAFCLNTSKYGYIYYFVILGGQEILAISKCYPNSQINYYSELYSLLESKCLLKGNRLVGPQKWEFEHNFSLKDDKYIQALIKMKQNEKMYLMLPLTSVNFPMRCQAQIDLASYICSNILEDSYPQYTLYEDSAKELFLQTTIKSPEKQIKPDAEQEIPVNSDIPPQESKENLQLSQQMDAPKSICFSQSISKVKVLNSANMEIQIHPEIHYNEFTSHRFPEDCFGLTTSVVKNYELYLKHKIQRNSCSPEGLSDFWKFQVDKQVLIDDHLYLFSLGQPIFSQNEWFTCILDKPEEKEFIFPLNKLVTRREHISLVSLHKTTIYYQTILTINQDIFFIVIDEDNPETIYYHTSLAKMVEIFNNFFDKLKQEQERDSGQRIFRATIQNTPPRCLSGEFILAKLQQQLPQDENMPDFDEILSVKLQKFFETRRSLFMKGFEEETVVVDCIQTKNILDPHLHVEIIMKQIDSYIKILFKTMELKEFSLFDIFFGIINEQYLCCQIMNKFQKNPLTYAEVQNLDSQLCAEIKEIFSKNTINQMYSLFIVPENQYIAAHRNFMHRTKKYDFQQYTYIDDFSKEKREAFLVVDNKKKYFSNKNDIIKEIIKNLVYSHQNQEIIRHFRQLLNIQVQKLKGLTPKLKNYFKMTKQEKKRSVSKESMIKFQQKCQEFDQTEKETVVDLMRKKKMKWVDQDFIFIVK